MSDPVNNVHARDDAADIEQRVQRSPKRRRVDSEPPVIESSKVEERKIPLLPPSHALLGVSTLGESGPDGTRQIMETDVGISAYIGRDVPKIEGIIKQRFTDFLVFEVDQNDRVIHLKSLDSPEPSKDANVSQEQTPDEPADSTMVPTGSGSSADNSALHSSHPANDSAIQVAGDNVKPDNEGPWPERFTTALSAYLSPPLIEGLKQMYLEGPDPPFVSDSGWEGRQIREQEHDGTEIKEQVQDLGKGKRGRGSRGRGGRGTRGARNGRTADTRKVVSEPISSKTVRTELHKAVRGLFKGKLDSETDTTEPADEDGSRIAIRWAAGGGGKGGHRESRGNRPSRGNFPPFIHFTLQKTNRDTQDALSYLSRVLHVNARELSVAGTKDKRGVTVQRVSLKRGNRTVENIWRAANGLSGRKSLDDVLKRRGDHGVRIADLNYRKVGLELGMLKGNAFVITLRNVQVDSTDTLERAMNTIKNKGFINYYGMQRFGTAYIPTHSIGLALLQSDWHKAVSLILQPRHGEHPDVAAARKAWLDDGDLDRALELMPRRVVAERAILESYKKQKGETRNAMGALSTIPRNLRLMYVHAYQSYVWNAIVSERITLYGAEKPVVGDLVFDAETTSKIKENVDGDLADEASDDALDDADDPLQTTSSRGHRKAWVPPKVKILTAEDVDKYSIFDVIMPLPGIDVAFPGDSLGERYKEFLRADGLDPDNFVRKQKEYCLGGSYRHILHLPKELSWSVLRYTDPDVPLAQADEDKLLGFDAPVVVDDGKFMALQIELILGTAAYATMALREVTKTETSSHFQSALTLASEDQKYKSTVDAGKDTMDVEDDVLV